MARAVRLFRDGRALLAGGGALYRVEPRARGTGRRPPGLAIEQARAHLAGKDDPLVKVAPLLAMIGDWHAFLESAMPEEELRDIRRHTGTGRPLGDEIFLDRLEGMVGRLLKPQKRGPKSRQNAN